MNHDARKHLEELLAREITVAQSLSGLLTAERAALTGDSPETVRATAADKIQLLGNLEELESQRRALWDAAEADASPGTAVAERWSALLAVMTACRAANDVNGYIIHIRQNQVRQLFDIVRGDTPMTYGRHGRSNAASLRALAQA